MKKKKTKEPVYSGKTLKSISKKLYDGEPTTFLERNILNMAKKRKRKELNKNKK